MQWWFCLIHQAVEEDSGCRNESRLGPYPSQQQAQGAIARMHKRDEEQDQLDE